MNIQSQRPQRINWKQIAIIAVVLGVAGFQYIRTQQNDVPKDAGGTAQLDLPSEIDLGGGLAQSDQPLTKKSQGPAGKPDLKFRPIKVSPKETAATNSSPANTPSNKSNVSKAEVSRAASGRPYLNDGQRGKKVSPAGLIYNSSRSGEHRTEHVLRHASDQPNRPGNHGVFDADGDDVFRLIDEAYELIQDKSRQVTTERPREGEEYKTSYVINMNRRIGFRGGQSGNRAGKPKLTKIKLILANKNQVITAYPF